MNVKKRFRIATIGLIAAMPSLDFAHADDYRLDTAPTFESGTGHIVTSYPRPDDVNVCNIYLKNLRYFAKKDVPMSCARPIAPNLEAIIKKVEWQDLDPDRYSDLLRNILLKESSAKDILAEHFRLRVEAVKKREYVFRRAELAFEGFLDNGANGPRSKSETLYIVQYGPNLLENINPVPIWHCEPKRGGLNNSWFDYLKLYVVSEDLTVLHQRLTDYVSGHHPTGGMFTINGRFYFDAVKRNGDVLLMQVQTQFPIGLNTVCVYQNW